MGFANHKIQFETLGDFLRKTRQSKGWELKDVERRINISESYLQALEENNYHQLPSPIYTRGFLERYVDFLGLDRGPIIERYRQENRFFEAKEKSLRQKGLKQKFQPGFYGFLKKKKMMSFDLEKFGIFIIVVALLIYFIWTISQSILPPKIIILSPPDNFETSEKNIQIKGRVGSQAIVKINDQPVSKFENGIFEETLNLPAGLNEIKISAKKKNSSETIIWRRIIVKE